MVQSTMKQKYFVHDKRQAEKKNVLRNKKRRGFFVLGDFGLCPSEYEAKKGFEKEKEDY